MQLKNIGTLLVCLNMSIELSFDDNNTDDRFVVAGSLLRSKRNEHGMTIDEIAEKTKLKAEYIKKVEDGAFSEINSKIYYYGYIKTLATLLNLDTQGLLRFVGYWDNIELTNTDNVNQADDNENVYIISSASELRNKSAARRGNLVLKIFLGACVAYVVISVIKAIFQ